MKATKEQEVSNQAQPIHTTHTLMKNYTTAQGNHYYIDGVFAFINLGGNRLTFWESLEELEFWVDTQY